MKRYVIKRVVSFKIARTGVLGVVAILAFLLLCGRLAYLQLYMGDTFSIDSETNRIRLITIRAPRGMFFDRYGSIIVDNRPSFDVLVTEAYVGDPYELDYYTYSNGFEKLAKCVHLVGFTEPTNLEKTFRYISDLCDIKTETVYESYAREKVKIQNKFHPRTVIRDLPRDKIAPLMTRIHLIPGVTIDVRPVRNYLYGALAPHLFGYVAEIDEKELMTDRYQGYRMGDMIGKRGVEESWDMELRGIDGIIQMEKDSYGRDLRVLGEVAPVPGNNLILTIDSELQEFARDIMEENDHAGAIIAMDPQNFEILVMVSMPGYDTATFARGITDEEWKGLTNDSRKPLMNRCISGEYPPGSTYKLITATAGLGEGFIEEDTRLYCGGYYNFGGNIFHCWKAGGHGRISIHRAIRESCDVFFYRVGNGVGIDRFSFYADGYNLGRLTGIKLPNEKPGINPSTEWKEGYFGERWYPGDTISCAIGQGYVILTPLQLLVAYAALANGGTVYEPMVVKEVRSPDGEPIEIYGHIETGNVPISEEDVEILKKGLYGVINEPGGTGWRARMDGIDVCGKTGTAQVIKGRISSKTLPYELRDHAWFVCFAPMENPEIAVLVLVEHGGFGGPVSAPIAGEIVKKYFELKGRRLQEYVGDNIEWFEREVIDE